MGIVRNILVRVGADVNGMQQGMKKAQTSLNKFSKGSRSSMNNFSYAMNAATRGASMNMNMLAGSLSMGKAGLIAFGAAAVGAFAMVSKKSIGMAMEVIESENLFAVSMGNMAGAARDWSNELQKTLGLNGYEVRKNVGLFYNMTTSMGLAQNQAYNLSTGLTQLAYDMSSFYNMTPEEMFAKLQSGITGEIEPLKRLGIIVNETTTKQYAYRVGIAKLGDELTEQQKVMARYAAIMDQTQNAQGDLARTIKSPTNQLRIMQMQLQLAQVNLGKAFMPIVEIVIPILTDFATSLARVTEYLAQFTAALFGTNQTQDNQAQTAASAANAQKELGDATKKAADKAKRSIAGFDEVNELQESMALNAEEAAEAVSTTPIPTKAIEAPKIPKEVQEYAKIIRESFTPALNRLGDAAKDLNESLKDLWVTIEPFAGPVFKFIYETIEGRVIGALYRFSGALDIVTGAAKILTGILKGDFETTLGGVEKVVEGAWQGVKGVTISTLNPIFPDIEEKLNSFETNWKNKWAGFKESIKQNGDPTKLEAMDFVIGIKDIMTGKLNDIQTFWADKWSKFKDNIKQNGDPTKLEAMDFAIAIKNIVVNNFNELKIGASNKFSELKISLQNKWTEIKNMDWDNLRLKVVTVFSNMKSGVSTKFTEMKSTIQTKWNDIKNIKWSTVKTAIEDSFYGLKTSVGNIFGSVETTAKGFLNNIISGVNRLIDGLNKLSVKIPKIPGITDGFSLGINIPNIPKLAQGGIISSPTLAMVGESGTEAVVPLEDTGFVNTLASAIGTAVLNAMQFANGNKAGESSSQPIVQIDGMTLARIMLPYLDDERSRIGTAQIKGA